MRLALVGTAAFVLGLASASTPSERIPVAMANCADRVYDRLFFGLGTAEGSVSESEWRHFLNHVVTPRFPGGLTVLEASGQWRAEGERKVTAERSRIVEIAHADAPDLQRRIDEIVMIYKRQHQQRSVMMTRARVEVCW